MSDEAMSIRPGAVTMVPGKSDAEKAEAYRAELANAMKPVLEILNRARLDNLVVQWNIAPDQFGRSALSPITVMKPL